MHALGRAYLLTGDKRYAHKALVLLHRFAEVYPEMDYEPQSRYGTMMRARAALPGEDRQPHLGNRHGHAWCEAYDACWDAIDTDELLQKETEKSGEQIRAFIEANLLEDAIDAYFQARSAATSACTRARWRTWRSSAVRRQDRWFDLLMNERPQTFSCWG
jgi:hypothetical protein